MYEEFNYIIEKIYSTPTTKMPFDVLYIEDFFSNEHFNQIINSKQISIDKQSSTEDLIDTLTTMKYSPVSFPGCTTNIAEYLKMHNNPNPDKKYNNQLLEGFGISFRMQEYDNPFLARLVDFLNSDLFHDTIKYKFGKTNPTRVETAIQKYVSGYEISPHPDIRKKCLTYMININTTQQSEDLDIHTYFLTFKEDKKHLYDYWSNNPSVERCWVPWDWCDTVAKHTKNNSITMFAPADDSLHAVKLDYDHCQFQRTQIYGNLWYTKGRQSITEKPQWQDLEKKFS
jgi:hypothetical protein